MPDSAPLTAHRILVVDNCIAVTGALKAILNTARALQAEYAGQFEFEFVLPTGSTALPTVVGEGFRVHTLPFVEISRRPGELLRYVPALLANGWRLRRLARQRGVALIHLNDFFNLAGVVAKWARGPKLLTHVRLLPQNFPAPLRRLWVSADTRYADRVICVSEAVQAAFPAAPNVLVVADPLPEHEQYPAPAPDQAAGRARTGELKLLYLANYIQGKGHDHAVEAFAAAHAQNPHLRLYFHGGDMGLNKNRAYRQTLEARVQALGLTAAVHFGEFVQDVEQAIKAADVLLNFSETESFSLTCLDALFYGTALVASDCGGPRELFEHGRSGLLVPNKDVPAMAAAILELAADAAKRTRFAAAGREYVRQKFSPDATYRKLRKVYLTLLAP
ncbi:glycosyltransferase family 4 protein [Hymenobacter caeli]|uniref:Glycosyltransferase involved in cell wall biosynthesis n=1 Tax=Hymenobacter caeli TaxID=2735894 RepID=A0ABX2FLE7_9BACT|nr:glycosyltransferase family 4 protein [Hymenobacter caeli]NRT17284.1 glycosyltransferase involved in cell wall biosynthesis [Hymenobacter caeli]